MTMTKWWILALAMSAGTALAQQGATWDASGNGLLNGDYNFRHVLYVTTDNSGTIGEELALYGVISFDGAGNYTVTGTQIDTGSNNGDPTPVTTSGTYTVAASGLGIIANPQSNGDYVYGLVSNGIFIGSSTESSFNDLLIAAPTSGATNAAFHGSYSVASMDVPSNDFGQIRDAWYQLDADGHGNLGNVSVSGQIADSGSTVLTQSLPSATYSFTGGVGTLAFPGPGGTSSSTLVDGSKTFYLSPDGTFLFGGSDTGFDMLVGVVAPIRVTDSDFAGLYYQAGLDQDSSQLNTGFSSLDSYYGALIPSQGLEISHKRFNSLFYANAFDYMFSDSYSLNSDGTSSDSFQSYWIGDQGGLRIGVGSSPYLGISVALRAPSFQGPGVFINPAGVVNAASSAPFTAGIAPGEFLTLYGTALSSGTALTGRIPFPTLLGGVQVLVNGVAAPMNYVSPGQVSFLVPYGTQGPVASFQVVSNGKSSNIVTSFVNTGSAGLFTNPPGGTSQAAAVHVDGSLVSEENPAQVGETLQFFAAGLGPVSPSISDGAAGPVGTLSRTTDTIQAYIDGQPATVSYSGLAPYFVGLYQLNAMVPAGIHSGDVFVDVQGTDSYSSQAYIPVSSGSGAMNQTAVRNPSQRSARRHLPKVSNHALNTSARVGRLRPTLAK